MLLVMSSHMRPLKDEEKAIVFIQKKSSIVRSILESKSP